MKAKIIIIALIIGIAAAVYFFELGQYLSLDYFKAQQATFNEYYQRNPLLVVAVFFLGYVALTGASVPAATTLTVLAGAIFGTAVGSVIVSFASSIGATIAFLVSRFLFRDAVESKFGDRLAKIQDGIEREGAFYVFGLRLVPLFPFVMLNSLLGLTKIKTWTFYWASQLGMVAGTIVYVNAGSQLAEIDSLGDIASPGLIASFVALGLLPIASKYILNILRGRKQVEES
ncbi:TVP38/TMEM64 family protein [Arenicella sp. 4NH20-0111]|uniref:TVP38/TMEM64 family protein n=1 Tax=Arenicella sp. 4NH20-0111 TaxID=3127648 RepID=UPI0031078752